METFCRFFPSWFFRSFAKTVVEENFPNFVDNFPFNSCALQIQPVTTCGLTTRRNCTIPFTDTARKLFNAKWYKTSVKFLFWWYFWRNFNVLAAVLCPVRGSFCQMTWLKSNTPPSAKTMSGTVSRTVNVRFWGWVRELRVWVGGWASQQSCDSLQFCAILDGVESCLKTLKATCMLPGIPCPLLTVPNTDALDVAAVFEDIVWVTCDPGYIIRESQASVFYRGILCCQAWRPEYGRGCAHCKELRHIICRETIAHCLFYPFQFNLERRKTSTTQGKWTFALRTGHGMLLSSVRVSETIYCWDFLRTKINVCAQALGCWGGERKGDDSDTQPNGNRWFLRWFLKTVFDGSPNCLHMSVQLLCPLCSRAALLWPSGW